MTSASGTTDAAQAWREVMLARHAHAPGLQPPRAAGGEQCFARSEDRGAVGPAYLFAGDGQSTFVAAPASARRPWIVSPIAETASARDPDIPRRRQRSRLTTLGAVAKEHLLPENREAGVAATGPWRCPAPTRTGKS